MHKNEWSTELYCTGCGFHELIKFEKARTIERQKFFAPSPPRFRKTSTRE